MRPAYKAALDGCDRVYGQIDFKSTERCDDQMLHLAIARSPDPHGVALQVDITDSLAIRGVLDVITAEKLRDAFGYVPAVAGHPLVADGVVKYAGQPVAVIVASSRNAARAGCDRVVSRVDPRPYALSLEEALRPGAFILDGGQDNIQKVWHLRHNDVEDGFRQADEVFEAEYRSAPASHVPLEPHSVSVVVVDDRVLIRSGTQSPHALRKAVCQAFGLGSSQVTVEVPPIGGAFGSKLESKVECLAVMAALWMRRSVNLDFTREDTFFTISKHEARIRLRTGVRDRRIVARDVEVMYNGGAQPKVTAARSGMLRAAGPYMIPNIRIAAGSVMTNSIPAGAMRGSMTTQVAFAYESEMDRIARCLGVDPVEFRRMNILHTGDKYITGAPVSGVYYDLVLNELEGAIRCWKRNPRPDLEYCVRGWGVGLMIKTTSMPSRSEAQVAVLRDGHVLVSTCSVDFGQGVYLALCLEAAQVLGVPVGVVRHRSVPATEDGLFDSLTASSRTTFSMGTAVRSAARNLLDQLEALASKCGVTGPLKGDSEEDIVRTFGEIVTRCGLQEVCAQGSYESSGGAALLDSETSQGPEPTPHWHQGGVAVELDVDLGTGKVVVARGHGVSFAGAIVNQAGVRAQNEGCFVYGLGHALFEELVYEDGLLTNPNMAEYLIPSIADVPTEMTSTGLEAPDSEIHGVGEMVVPAVGPAIANAVCDAIGERIFELPLTPERVLYAIERRAIE